MGELKLGSVYKLSQWQDKKAIYLGRLSEREEVQLKHVITTKVFGEGIVIYRFGDDYKLSDNILSTNIHPINIDRKEKDYLEGLLKKAGID